MEGQPSLGQVLSVQKSMRRWTSLTTESCHCASGRSLCPEPSVPAVRRRCLGRPLGWLGCPREIQMRVPVFLKLLKFGFAI